MSRPVSRPIAPGLTVRRLTVLRVEMRPIVIAGRSVPRTVAVCRCACGTAEFLALPSALRGRRTGSCGCLRRAVSRDTAAWGVRLRKARAEAARLRAAWYPAPGDVVESSPSVGRAGAAA